MAGNVTNSNRAGAPRVTGRARKQAPTQTNPSLPEESTGATQSIAEGKIQSQAQTYPDGDIDVLVPVGSEAELLRNKALQRSQTTETVNSELKKAIDSVAAATDVVGITSVSHDRTFDVAAALIGARLPGLEEHTVQPDTLLTRQVADPILVADVELNTKPQPVFADIMDGAAVTVQVKTNN